MTIENRTAPTNTGPRPGDDPEGMVDVQVIGGGIAGATAATLVAAQGASVRLIERRATAGGRARSDDHHGFRLNRGPHALYRHGHLGAVLAELGLHLSASPPPQRGTTGSIDGRIGRLPVGPSALATTSLLPARSKFALARLMAIRLRRIDPATLASVTVDEFLDDVAPDPHLRTLLWGLVNLTTYNAASDLASADGAVAQLQLAERGGVLYVDRGWSSIVEALARRVPEDANLTGDVVSVGSDDGCSWCRTADGSRWDARSTIVAVGLPAVADRLLGTGGRLAAAAGPPVVASALDLGLRRTPHAPAHLGLDRRLYASVHSVAAGVAPADRTLLCVARYGRADETTTPAATRAELRAFAGEVGVDADDVVMERYLHRLTVAGGMPLASTGGLRGRPSVELASHPGIFLAGDWVGPEGLLADAAAASARAAADAAVGHARRRQGMLV